MLLLYSTNTNTTRNCTQQEEAEEEEVEEMGVKVKSNNFNPHLTGGEKSIYFSNVSLSSFHDVLCRLLGCTLYRSALSRFESAPSGFGLDVGRCARGTRSA